MATALQDADLRVLESLLHRVVTEKLLMSFSKLATVLALSFASVLSFHSEAESHGRHRYYRYYYPGWGYWGGYYGYPFYYGGYYGYGGFYGAPYSYARVYYAPDRVPASLRIEVKPVEAEVYVDGYFAGTVDEFDGFFQRLTLAPGNREIVIYLGGHRTIREKLHLSPGGDYKIRRAMEPLAQGETIEPPPEPPAEEKAEIESRAEPAVPISGFGILELRVRPEGAEITIDGDPWPSDEPSDPLVIHLPAGEHRVEIRSAGRAPFETEVLVEPGKTTILNVKLPR
jgi:hypothetical protein